MAFKAIYFGLMLAIVSTSQMYARADLSKQVGQDKCKWVYKAQAGNEFTFGWKDNGYPCLAESGKVWCIDPDRLMVRGSSSGSGDYCGRLGVDYKTREGGYSRGGSITHWKQSSGGQILTGYRCSTTLGQEGCIDSIKTSTFKYSHKKVATRDAPRDATINTREAEKYDGRSKGYGSRTRKTPWWQTQPSSSPYTSTDHWKNIRR